LSTDLAVVFDAGAFEVHRKLGNLVQYFQVNLPTNAHGIPLQLIDPGVLIGDLPKYESSDDVPSAVIKKATWDITMEEAMPLIDGVPIWERLDGEPVPYYGLFKAYREALYLEGARAVIKLSQSSGVPVRNLTMLSRSYHWAVRCKAYDLFKKMQAARMREIEIEKLEGKHAKVADKLLEMSMEYLEDHTAQLSPKTAIQLLQVAAKMGRLAVGLQADKPGTDSGGTSINISQTAMGGSDSSSNSDGPLAVNTTEDLSHLQSILHILDKSGAFPRTTVVDADYEVVPDDPK
jgi:hypothetical protein